MSWCNHNKLSIKGSNPNGDRTTTPGDNYPVGQLLRGQLSQGQLPR